MERRRNQRAKTGITVPLIYSVSIIVPLAFAALVLYGRTAYPDVGPTDSGELIAACWVLGVAHAPGFPTYVTLGWLWSHLFTDNPALAMNVFSGVGMVVAGIFLFFALIRWIEPISTSIWLPLTMAVLGTALFWQADLVWRWATVAEVYGLVVAMLGIIGWFVLRPKHPGSPIGIGLLWGLALHSHLVSALFFLPLIGVVLWSRFPRRTPVYRRPLWQFAFAATIVYMLGAAFLFWRAQAQPLINWGAPATLERLWYHLTAKQYQVSLFHGSWQRWGTLLLENFQILNQAVTILGLIGSVVAIIGLWQFKFRKLVVAIVGTILVILGYTAVYDIPQDRDAYLLPLLWMISWLVPVGIAFALRRWKVRVYSIGLVLLLAMIAVFVRYPQMDRSQVYLSPTLVKHSLQAVETKALVLTANWQLYSPFLYQQIVRSQYPDVIMIDIPLWQNRAWYVEQFLQQHPDLAQHWQPALEKFLYYLQQFERDELHSTVEIEHWYRQLLWQMLHQTPVPVYFDLSALRHLQHYQVLEHLPAPNQLLFQYRPLPRQSIAFMVSPPLTPAEVVLDPVEQEIVRLYEVMANIHQTFYERRSLPED